MKKRFAVLLLVGFLIGSSLLVYQLKNASGSQEKWLPAVATSIPTKTVVPNASNVTIANEIKGLSDKWGEQFLRGVGWLHVVTQYNNDQDNGGTLPNGQLIPANYTLEDWHQLDIDNQVVSTVNFMLDENGKIVQEGLFKDGLWHNLTVNETFPGETVPLTFDFGFEEEVLRSQTWGGQVSRNETIAAENQSIISFTIHDPQTQPRVIAGYTKKAIGGEARAAFDAQSGRILWVEHVLIMEDGEQRVINRAEIVTVERVSVPPQEVLSLLEGVTK